ncbi:hypothetical protein ILYODFUR_024557 [Ilyodon furcidens]|uniref:Uncharacterized protein n=1 Tax=Ilyodon furcidens TaxID=33524 RepID=A0ABV0UW28_9TELE
MPVTHIRKEDTTPHLIRCNHTKPQPPLQPLVHDSHSSTPPSPPNHSANASSHSPPVHERETCTSGQPGRAGQPLQAEHNLPARQRPGTLPTPHLNPRGAPAYSIEPYSGPYQYLYYSY